VTIGFGDVAGDAGVVATGFGDVIVGAGVATGDSPAVGVFGESPDVAALGSPMSASTAPGDTAVSAAAIICNNRPEIGATISMSSLSVDTSTKGSSTVT
jgi:hypothetical protein